MGVCYYGSVMGVYYGSVLWECILGVYFGSVLWECNGNHMMKCE